jgi:alcohol dehydrogenase (cytochrome c)
MKTRPFPARAAAACGIALIVGLVSLSAETLAQSQGPGWDARRSAQLDIDVRELPGQVVPPSPGDTDWPHYNRRLDGNRYSELHEIDASNVGGLEEACRVHVSGPGPLSSGNILVNGIMYLTAARATVAIEPVTCDIIWKSIYTPEETEIYNANRGVAYLDSKVFRGTGDGRLVAYDANTGRELWRKKFGDPANGEYADAAPLAWDGKVFIGLAPSDLGISGRVRAFDANTGEQIWNFNTIPGPGEYGNDTWPGDTWKLGGGGTWSSYTLDTEKGELFVPVDNPAPAFDAHVRKGNNLFTDSVLVLDARTGKRIWHFQVLKNDNHDYGLASPPVLLDLDKRKVVAQASQDGFVYLIDRTSEKLIWKTPVTTLLNNNDDAKPEGVKVCPGAKGGVEYNSPGFDPNLGLLIVGSVDWCYKLFAEPYASHVPGNPYTGGRMDRGDDSGTGWVTALDARTGTIKWRYHTPAPVIAAITPTAGGLTFAGDVSGVLYVFRTRDGQLLRQIQTGGAMAGAVITYQIRNHQYLAIDSGNISRSSWSDVGGTPTLIVYRLPEVGAEPQGNLSALTPNPAHGQSVYQATCALCHGPAGQGLEGGPSLKGLSAKYTHEQALTFIASPKPPMPKLYPNTISAQDVADVAAYVRTLPPP